MKVFEYDIHTGTRGKQIADISRPDQSGGWYEGKVMYPANRKSDEQWLVFTRASRYGKPIEFDCPVCFCTGQVREGTDTFWEWIILMPQTTEVV